jgi:hypothetical protein
VKAHKLYECDAVLGPLPLPPGQTGEPTALVLIECPYCPTMVPWNFLGTYNWSLAGRNRRTVTDDEGRVRPLCLACSDEVTTAEDDTRQAAREALEDSWTN